LSRIILGIDPGQSGAIALISETPGALPIVLGAWSIDGNSKGDPWFDRAIRATSQACALAERNGGLSLIVSEIPGGGGASRKPLSPVTWLTMGRRLGEVVAMVRLACPKARAVDVDSGMWPKALRVPVGKKATYPNAPDGWHRTIEAGTLTRGLGATYLPEKLTAAQANRLISQAEAVLIAVAGGRLYPLET
jgi:hypothetical protein